MKKREKLLAIVVGLMVLGYVGNWLFARLLQGPLAERNQKIEKLKSDIAKQELQLRRARQAAAKLTEWQRRSLPKNREVAASLYQDWLLELVGRAGFKLPNVDSGEPLEKKDIYQRLPFSVRGRGTLEQLTKFLYEFYRADHLHQIQRISITPLPKSQDLELSLAIEALVLPEADREDRLATRRSTRLASETLPEYASIVERNLFGQGGAIGADPADYAFLTAILDVDGLPQAWFTIRTTGEIVKVSQGQSFELGQFRGTIAAIESPDIVIDSDEERWLLTLGENLSQATALPPQF